jgi:hypothetical protein
VSLFLEAYGNLVAFEFYVARGRFDRLYERVRLYPTARKARSSAEILERHCFAVDMACIWYWKQVLCLQRSAATTCLLRKHGIAAQLVIGAQQIPFRAHAWVEVSGKVVNDKPYTPEMYSVLDRC